MAVLDVDIKRGRAPSGARGLKLETIIQARAATFGRAPSGARGLKLNTLTVRDDCICVAPLRGRVD